MTSAGERIGMEPPPSVLKAYQLPGRPEFLDRPRHRWAIADHVAWGEATAPPMADLAAALLDTLTELRQPMTAGCQLVHGDLAGNVLFAPRQSPAIIDISPYWRPPAYAEAIAALDGIMWYEMPTDLLGRIDPQMLVRALILPSGRVARARGVQADGRAGGATGRCT